MRLFIAALSFLISLFAITSAIMALLPPDPPEWMTTVGFLAGFSLSLFLTNTLVNVRGTNFWSLSRATEPGEQQPEQDGLFVSTEYRANRCFQVVGADQDGPHYFIELSDGKVLHLHGRYLDALGPRKMLGMIDLPRKFPCTKFAVRRDRVDGCMVDIQCSGTVLEPDTAVPSFNELDFKKGTMPQDGDIIMSRTYAEMKAGILEFSGRAGH